MAHFISERSEEDRLSHLIIKSADKEAKYSEKSLANLAKLALLMSRNEGFQRLQEIHA